MPTATEKGKRPVNAASSSEARADASPATAMRGGPERDAELRPDPLADSDGYGGEDGSGSESDSDSSVRTTYQGAGPPADDGAEEAVAFQNKQRAIVFTEPEVHFSMGEGELEAIYSPKNPPALRRESVCEGRVRRRHRFVLAATGSVVAKEESKRRRRTDNFFRSLSSLVDKKTITESFFLRKGAAGWEIMLTVGLKRPIFEIFDGANDPTQRPTTGLDLDKQVLLLRCGLPLRQKAGLADGSDEEDERGGGFADDPLLLRAVYSEVNRIQAKLPRADPPPGLHPDLPMKDYQLQSLYFVLRREAGVEDPCDRSAGASSERLHPLFAPVPDDLFNGAGTIFYHRVTGRLTRAKPKAPEACRGGILADEMGLGKSVVIGAATIVSPRDPRPDPSDEWPAGTLVVCPPNLVPQWRGLLRRHFPGRLADERVVVLFTDECAAAVGRRRGARREDVAKLPKEARAALLAHLAAAAVVVASFDDVRDPNARDVLQDLTWWRLVLDEAQSAGNERNTLAAGLGDIPSVNRWAVTGTPIVRSLNDLKGALSFLRHDPFGEGRWLRLLLLDACDSPVASEREKGGRRLARFLAQIMRRQNIEPVRDQLNLPPHVDEDVFVEMLPHEASVYNSKHHALQRKVMERRASHSSRDLELGMAQLRRLCTRSELAAPGRKPGVAAGVTGRQLHAKLVDAAQASVERTHLDWLWKEAEHAVCILQYPDDKNASGVSRKGAAGASLNGIARTAVEKLEAAIDQSEAAYDSQNTPTADRAAHRLLLAALLPLHTQGGDPARVAGLLNELEATAQAEARKAFEGRVRDNGEPTGELRSALNALSDVRGDADLDPAKLQAIVNDSQRVSETVAAALLARVASEATALRWLEVAWRALLVLFHSSPYVRAKLSTLRGTSRCQLPSRDWVQPLTSMLVSLRELSVMQGALDKASKREHDVLLRDTRDLNSKLNHTSEPSPLFAGMLPLVDAVVSHRAVVELRKWAHPHDTAGCAALFKKLAESVRGRTSGLEDLARASPFSDEWLALLIYCETSNTARLGRSKRTRDGEPVGVARPLFSEAQQTHLKALQRILQRGEKGPAFGEPRGPKGLTNSDEWWKDALASYKSSYERAKAAAAALRSSSDGAAPNAAHKWCASCKTFVETGRILLCTHVLCSDCFQHREDNFKRHSYYTCEAAGPDGRRCNARSLLRELRADKRAFALRVEAEEAASPGAPPAAPAAWQPSDALREKYGSKFAAILRELQRIAADKRKAVVFSEFPAEILTPLLAACEEEEALGISCANVFSGSAAAKAAALARFLEDPHGEVTACFLPTKAGCFEGLNLTCASTVIFVEPSMNFAMEDQAARRILRLGQTSPTVVKYFLATIPERRTAPAAQKPRTVDEIVRGLSRAKRAAPAPPATPAGAPKPGSSSEAGPDPYSGRRRKLKASPAAPTPAPASGGAAPTVPALGGAARISLEEVFAAE